MSALHSVYLPLHSIQLRIPVGNPIFEMGWFCMGIVQIALEPVNMEKNHPGKPLHPRANVGKKCKL